ncbi:MAG: hypothetical protein NVS2B3_02820 [Vulcanimicrobiaceae bacterium]
MLIGCFVVALALAGIGIARVVTTGRALKKRADGYKTLPIADHVERTRGRVGRASRRIETAPALVYRANAALREIGNARVKVVAIVTSPSALWRLGELVVTGK